MGGVSEGSWGSPWGVLESFVGCPGNHGRHLGQYRGVVQASWCGPGGLGGFIKRPWRALEASWPGPGGSWRRLGAVLEGLGSRAGGGPRVLEAPWCGPGGSGRRLGTVLQGSGGLLGLSWAVSEASWASWRPPGGGLTGSWRLLEALLGGLGGFLTPCRCQFCGTLQIIEKL